MFLGQLTQQVDGLTHLFQIVPAALTPGDMALESFPIRGR
jgi:hypothetical protein